LFLIPGCDKIKSALERDVEVSDVDFESEEMEAFPETGEPSGNPDEQSEIFYSFKEVQSLSLDEFEGASTLKKYSSNLIKSVSVEEAAIIIIPNPDAAGTVKEFKATVEGITPYTIEGDYALGTVHRTGMKEFIEKVLFQILITKDSKPEGLQMTIEGKTNLPESVKLKARIQIKGIKVKVQLMS
jgi:hypothetical protein